MFYRRQGDLIGSTTAKAFRLAGPNLVSDTACAASSYAIGEAFRLIATGRADVMLTGGACAIVSPIALLAFTVLGALSGNPDPEQASRPFDRRRDGFVMGEGAGAVVLERYDLAVKRGATIYGELAGYGMTMNAHTLTDPSPDGSAEARAMTLALDEAGLTPGDIDYIAAHGTSTPKNDASESAAIRTVFQADASRVMVSSNKGQVGHTISAAGVFNLICATKAIGVGVVPPTAHYAGTRSAVRSRLRAERGPQGSGRRSARECLRLWRSEHCPGCESRIAVNSERRPRYAVCNELSAGGELAHALRLTADCVLTVSRSGRYTTIAVRAIHFF